MGGKSRRKGKVGELEAAKALRDIGIEARRGRQFSGSPDSPDVATALAGVSIEVKRCEALQLRKALKQAADEASGKVPVVLHRWNRAPDWYAIVPLGSLVLLSEIVVATVKGGDDG